MCIKETSLKKILLIFIIALILSVMYGIEIQELVDRFVRWDSNQQLFTKEANTKANENTRRTLNIGDNTAPTGQSTTGENSAGHKDLRAVKSVQSDMDLSANLQFDEKGGIRKRLPQAFMIGAGKCGTGTLRTFLLSHPNIVMPKTEEMWFYDAAYKKGYSWYLSQMPTSSPEQMTIEASPGYFHNQWAMQRIIHDNPKGLFIVILRDPVDRAISDYLHILEEKHIDQSDLAYGFQVAAISNGKVNHHWRPIYYGIYSNVLKRWLNLIPQQRLCVIDGTAFAKNPVPQLKVIEKFLGIPNFFNESNFVFMESKGFYCLKKKDGSPDCMPESKGRAHPQIKKSVLDKLEAFYKPFNEELYAILGRRFDWK